MLHEKHIDNGVLDQLEHYNSEFNFPFFCFFSIAGSDYVPSQPRCNQEGAPKGIEAGRPRNPGFCPFQSREYPTSSPSV